MANIIHNPDNVPQAVTTGYQRQNNVLFAGNTGFMNINIFPNGFISQGTVFEINGVLFKVENDEIILDFFNQGINKMFFVYAVPISDDVVNFQASIEVPQWDNLKGGWYSENNSRALIRVFTNEGGAIWAMAQMTGILYSASPPNVGGVSVYFKNVKYHEVIELPAGWYRYDIVSGLGDGNAEDFYTDYTVNNIPIPTRFQAGGIPERFNRLRGVFYHNGGDIIVNVGGNGFKGGNGRYVAPRWSGGGGSGAGEESYIIINGSNKITTGHIKPGNGSSAFQHNSGIIYSLLGQKGFGLLKSGILPNVSPPINLRIGDGIDGTANVSYKANGGGGFTVYYYVSSGNTTQNYMDDAMTLGNGIGGGGGGSVAGGAAGGGGGAPGWGRQEGDEAAGYVEIFSLFQ